MTLKLTVKIPAAVAELLNGLESHVEDIQEFVLNAPAGTPWKGWIVAQVETVEAGRLSETGGATAQLIITAVELMEGSRGGLVKQLFDETHNERLVSGSLMDEEVVADSPLVPKESFDPYENPDLRSAPLGTRTVTTVDLPDDEVPGWEQEIIERDRAAAAGNGSARERAARLWSPADDVRDPGQIADRSP